MILTFILIVTRNFDLATDLATCRQGGVHVGVRYSTLNRRENFGKVTRVDLLANVSASDRLNVCRRERSGKMSASRGTSRRSGWTGIGRRRAAEPKDNAAIDTSLSDVNMRLCHCTLQSRICQLVVNPTIVN